MAENYAEVMGAEFIWIDEQEFLNRFPAIKERKGTYWRYVYDRCFDRVIDNTKVLRATGLCKDDFCTIKQGLKIELDIYHELNK